MADDKGRIHFHDGTYIDVGETPVVKDEDWPAHLAEWSHRIAEEQERLIVAIRAYKYPSNDEENTAICQEILFWLREFERSELRPQAAKRAFSMKPRPPRSPHTLFNTHFDRATKTMMVDGFALMQNGKYVPAYEEYLKNTLLDIRAIYQRLKEDGGRINELRNDPDRREKAEKVARLNFEIGDILYQAEQIIWQRLSLMGVRKA